jgi:hypothetical protein
MQQVAAMMDRPFRLVAQFSAGLQQAGSMGSGGGGAVRFQASSYQNLPPTPGEYQVEVHVMQPEQCIWGTQACFEAVGRGTALLSAEGLELLLLESQGAPLSPWTDAALVALDFV